MKRELRPSALPSLPLVLKKLMCAAVVGAVGTFVPAHAGVITFDNVQNVVTPLLNAGDSAYNTGDAFTEAGFLLRANNSASAEPDEYGGVGARIDSDNVFACVITSCPVGNGSTYYGALNDGTLNIISTIGSNLFQVKGLEFGFIGPVAGMPNFSYGQLVLTGTTASGATISTSAAFAGQNNAGRFVFDQFGIDAGFGTTVLSSLTISACLFDDNGSCTADRSFTQNQAQFGIDNLRLAEVPEPGSIALLLLGIAGLSATSRRRAK